MIAAMSAAIRYSGDGDGQLASLGALCHVKEVKIIRRYRCCIRAINEAGQEGRVFWLTKVEEDDLTNLVKKLKGRNKKFHDHYDLQMESFHHNTKDPYYLTSITLLQIVNGKLGREAIRDSQLRSPKELASSTRSFLGVLSRIREAPCTLPEPNEDNRHEMCVEGSCGIGWRKIANSNRMPNNIIRQDHHPVPSLKRMLKVDHVLPSPSSFLSKSLPELSAAEACMDFVVARDAYAFWQQDKDRAVKKVTHLAHEEKRITFLRKRFTDCLAYSSDGWDFTDPLLLNANAAASSQ